MSKNSSALTNIALIADRLKTKQVYDVVKFMESENKTNVGDPMPRKMYLEGTNLKIEGLGVFDLKICECEWKDNGEILSIYPKANPSINIHFD